MRKNRPTKVFLDLDDVLNTFTMSALREVGCPVGPFDFDKFDPAWGFDIVRAARELLHDATLTENEFWNGLSSTFWKHIPKSEESNWLLNLCETLVGRDNVFILTAIPGKVGKHVASAKVAWIHENLPAWLHDQFLIGSCKHVCAGPNTLLIDDTDRNVNSFRRVGGQAILFPRPWNLLYRIPAEPWLRTELSRTFN